MTRPPSTLDQAVRWARRQMRALDRWTSKAILAICFAGIIIRGHW